MRLAELQEVRTETQQTLDKTPISEPVTATSEQLRSDTDVPDVTQQPLAEADVTYVNGAPLPVTITHPPEQTIKQDSGWDCALNEEHQSWNCSLTGNDPKGQARIMDEGTGFRLLDPAFDRQEEQTFNALQTELKYDPWNMCTLRLGQRPVYESEIALREQSPLDVGADYTEVFDNEVVEFSGNVFVTRADQRITANRASYDTRSKALDLQGNVIYSEEGVALFGDNAQVELEADQARLRNAQFIFPVTPMRGSAAVAYRENAVLNHFKEVAYTSCRPGNQDWVMHASRLKMNDYTGKGSVKHAWLEFKSVPIFYLPYMSFPLDDRRQSGLLTPSFGSTQRSGVDIRVPYYWNIAPNYDATFWARYLSKRSAMFGGEFRYLTEKTTGSVELEILPYDTRREETRWQGSVENYTVFTPRLRSNLDVNYVSDEDYFDDLGDSLSFSNNRHLYSYADLLYNRPGVSFSTRVDNYQTIDITIPDASKPYRRLPQVLMNFNHSFEFMPLDVGLDNEFVYFQHDDIVNGQRLNVKPYLSIPIKDPGYYITPKISAQFTQYWLQNQNQGVPNNISRLLPVASIDSGLFFERNFDFADTEFLHTIEPRLFYLYIPNKNQDDIPLFDTSEYDFTFSQMFRENRFNGPDRIQDANQLTMAVTTRLIDSGSGQQMIDLSLGNIIYFQDREVQLSSSAAVQTERFSNLIAELNAQLFQDVTFQSGLQYNPKRNDIDRGNVSLRYRNAMNHILNVGYRYRNDLGETLLINQTDVSFLLPVYDNWNIVGRWQYSILHNLTVESFVGFEKESCCWRLRFIARRFVNNVDNVDKNEGEAETAFYVQFELKSLTSIGNDVESFLENNLYGYRAPER